jgi:hypothetical protein
VIDIETLKGTDYPGFFLGVLTSLREFDRREVEGVLSGIFGITKREECFYALYLRAQRNVDTLLDLKHVAHFQAIAMLSRAMFELRMDAEMLAKTADGDLRMRVYKSLELLRAARSLVKHEDSHSNQGTPSERRRYVTEMGPLVEREARALWPDKKLTDLRHWSGLAAAQRAKDLGPETEALYFSSYQQFSWYLHGGIQGTLDALPDHFPRVCGIALSLSVLSYSRLLTTVARAVRITTHDPDFGRKLELALGLPQVESAEDETQLRREVGH